MAKTAPEVKKPVEEVKKKEVIKGVDISIEPVTK